MLPAMRSSSSTSFSFFSAVVFVAGVVCAGSAAAQDPCTDGDPETCDADGNVVFCNAGTTQTFDCNTLAAGSAATPSPAAAPAVPPS